MHEHEKAKQNKNTNTVIERHFVYETCFFINTLIYWVFVVNECEIQNESQREKEQWKFNLYKRGELSKQTV